VFFFVWDTDATQNVPSTDPPAASPQNNNDTRKEAPDLPSTKSDTPIATQDDGKQSANPPLQIGYDENLIAMANSKIRTPTVLTDENLKSGTAANDGPLKPWKEMLRQPKPDYG
jgi:hypothetical protein